MSASDSAPVGFSALAAGSGLYWLPWYSEPPPSS